MSAEFIEILDEALERLRKNDSVSEILESYADQAEYLAPLLGVVETLKAIQPVELLSEDVMQVDRAEFLASVENREVSPLATGLWVRFREQVTSFINYSLVQRKRSMGVLFARAMLVLILFFGVTGGSYALAANSLPDTPLYDAKLALEQVQLQMKTDPADIAGQHLVIARNRVREIIRLAQAGKVSDDGVMARLENHLNTSLQLASQFGDDGEMQGVLTQAMNMLQDQIQALTQTQAHGSGASQAQLQRTIQLLTRAQNQVELGLQDPNAFRWQVQNSAQIGDPGCSNCSCVDCEPEGDQNQYGSQPEQPGPGQPDGNPDCPSCPCVDCEPEGVQNQEQNQYGPQPGQPGPGQPGGNPDCPNCEPEGDQNQYGPQPEQPGPGQPGGNPDCSNCEPEGEQNQYGPQPEQPGPNQSGGNPDCLESLDNVCIPLGTPGPNRPDLPYKK